MAKDLYETTAGVGEFSPLDTDFLPSNSVVNIPVEAFEGDTTTSLERPTGPFSLINLATLIITPLTAIKRVLLGDMVATNSIWFDGMSSICRQIKDNSYSWRALEIIYPLSTNKRISRIDHLTRFWNNLNNAKAVRNRLNLTRTILKKELEERSLGGKVKILSIASGSARAVLEAIRYVSASRDLDFDFRLIDLDPTAIDFASKLSHKLELQANCTFLNISTSVMDDYLTDFQPDIIEMVGFLEYRSKEKAIKLLKRLKDLVAVGGVVIVSQVRPNREMYFLRWVMNWPMVYRDRLQFKRILSTAGYVGATIFEEPTSIHMICRYHKNK